MSREIEYFNARLWGMRSFLLPEALYESLLEANTRDAWTSVLRDTPYGEFLGPSFELDDSRVLFRAIDASIAQRTHRLTRLASGRPAVALRICLAEQDLQNLLTVVSGIHHHSSPLDILSGTLAGSLIGSEQLQALVHCHNTREAADYLTTWGYPYHSIFRRSLGRHPDKPLSEQRLDLNRGFMDALIADAHECGYPVILRFMRERIDRTNLITALMWRSLPSDRAPSEFFLPRGQWVQRKTFNRMLAASSLGHVISLLPPGPFKTSANRAEQKLSDPTRISLFETSLEWEIIHRYSRPLTMDPLGAEWTLGFLLRLRREGIRIKQSLTRLLYEIPIDLFLEMSAYA